jgi:hypothetical protein
MIPALLVGAVHVQDGVGSGGEGGGGVSGVSVSFSCQIERQDWRLVPVIMGGTEVNSESIAFHSVSCLVYLQLPYRIFLLSSYGYRTNYNAVQISVVDPDPLFCFY